jgi:hypothetical protein
MDESLAVFGEHVSVASLGMDETQAYLAIESQPASFFTLIPQNAKVFVIDANLQTMSGVS